MERHSFLCSMPFLYPISSPSWPPRTRLSQDRAAGRRETLLVDHFLSIEPLSYEDNAISTLGPAFYGTSSQNSNDFDPGMCQFEMVIYYTDSLKAKGSPLSLSRVGSASKSPRTPVKNRTSNEADTKNNAVYARMAERVFQVDLTQINNIEFHFHEGDADTMAKPPCLIINFGFCCFRIFSMSGGDAADQFSMLNSIKVRLEECISAGSGPFPCTDSRFNSPSISSSDPSSNEHGQPEIARTVHRNDYVLDGIPTKQSADSHKVMAPAMKRRRTSSLQSIAGLESLEELLELPASDSNEAPNDAPVHPGKILNAVADDLASSYCDINKLFDADNQYQAKADESQAKLDELLKDFFPISRPNKRRSRGGQTTSYEEGTSASSEDLVKNAKKLVQQHQQVVKARHALLLLPHRG